MLSQFDQQIFLILHTIWKKDDFLSELDQVQKDAKKIINLADAFKDAGISENHIDAEQLRLAQIRDETRLNAEAAIWALTLSSKIVVDKTKPEYGTPDDEYNGNASDENLDAGTEDPPSGVPLTTESNDPKVEFIGVDSRLQKYLRNRLVKPETLRPFDTDEMLYEYLGNLVEYFEKHGLKNLISVSVVNYPLSSDPLDAGVH